MPTENDSEERHGHEGELGSELRDLCVVTATSIAAEVAKVKYDDCSLRGAAAALLLFEELGPDAPPIENSRLAEWRSLIVKGLPRLRISFYDGPLGAAWALDRLGDEGSKIDLSGLDRAVLKLLGKKPWRRGLDPFGGLVGIGLYGMSRSESQEGSDIVAHCIGHFDASARREGAEVRWSPQGMTVSAAEEPVNIHLLNMEGSSAVVAFLAAAGRRGDAGALSLAREGARTLAKDLDNVDSRTITMGEPSMHAAPGLVHGSGTWALGSAGAACALLSVATATGSADDLERATRFGRKLADIDPESCDALDVSFGTGSIGIACTLLRFFEVTHEPAFRISAEYWFRRTLRKRRAGVGIGGYLYFDALHDWADGGGAWRARPGLLEGAAGTALGLLCAARGTTSTSWGFLGLLT